MHESVALCKQSMYSQSPEVANAARLLIGQANRVTQTAVRLVNKHEDLIFRNGVMAFIKQLKKGIVSFSQFLNTTKLTPFSYFSFFWTIKKRLK